MRNFLETARIVALATPLAIVSATSSANEFTGTLGSGIADMVIDSTKDKTEKAMSWKNAKAQGKWTASEQDFRSEVRHYLEREKCYVISNAPKNARTWLAAIGKFDAINERAPKNYGKKTAKAIENAKNRLEAERQKAHVPFGEIMDGERRMNDRERKCLAWADKVES